MGPSCPSVAPMSKRAAGYIFQTPPFDHQAEVFKLSRDADYFALLMEQGTGKTKVVIDSAGYRFERRSDAIEALVVIAPNEGDIPDNWVDQVEIHLPTRIPRLVVRMRANQKSAERKTLDFMMKSDNYRGLRILTVNVEAIRSGSPIFNYLLKFCRKYRVMLVLDESSRIKSSSAAQTRGAIKLGRNAVARRIMSGTPITKGPLDAYSQFDFLQPGLLGGFDSLVAYKAHYCQLLPPENGLVRYTANKLASKIQNPAGREAFVKKMVSILQMPARGPDGIPLYKNLDQLEKHIAKVSYRKLKVECLDLPPKLYATPRYVELTPKQREIYDEVKREVIAEFIHDGVLTEITVQLAITRLLRLQQIVCNHYAPDPDPDDPSKPLPKRIEETKNNPRIHALQGIIDEAPEVKGIIWCRHHPELNEVYQYLCATYDPERVVQLHGKIKGDARVAARKRFQDPKSGVQWLVGQVRSGIGIDLYEASWEVFYSNSYSLEQRLQAEDRGHRIGLKHPLTIFDIVARDTLDPRIIATLRANKEVSDMILGDNPMKWI